MAAITAKMVNDLRSKTGVGMMDCKKALVESNGDFDEAVKILREKGLGKADKKASRIAAEGVVDIMVEGDIAAMIEVNAETDFVAKNETFKAFVKGLLKVIVTNKPADVEALKALRYDDTFETVEAKLKDMIYTIGENMNIRRFAIVEGVLSTYIHGSGMAGVIVKFDACPCLSEKEAKLLSLRFGLEGGLPLSPAETGKKLGMTSQEVVQAEAQALLKLRKED